MNGAAEQGETRKAFGRRSLIAGAAALAAAAIAKQSIEPVAAAAYNLQGDTTNTASAPTIIAGSVLGATLDLSNTHTGQGVADGLSTSSMGGYGVFASGAQAGVYASGPIGVQATGGTGDGVQGSGGTNLYANGVYGNSAGKYGNGVRGESGFIGVSGSGVVFGLIGSASGSNGTGVSGYASDPAGVGISGDSVGIYGISGHSQAAGGIGVSGACTGGYGVLGTVSDGYGVLGQAVTGNGLYGFSQQKHGIVGQTTGVGFGGVYGIATTPNTVGIYGSTVNPGSGNVASAYAGYFDGNFVAVHGFKSAAVPHHDGSYRLVYCMESPEAWFEDFGEGKITGGKAAVTLDPEFAAIVETTGYHVYLTEYDDHNNLYVTNRSATGFTVAAKGTVGTAGGANSNAVKAGSGTFGYRVVAKRKDIKAERLAKFTLPMTKEAHTVQSAALPKPPQAPTHPQFPAVTIPPVRKP